MEKKTDRETIYQVALLQSLTLGQYDGFVKVKTLKRHGDTGIGTFDSMDGELIMLDGLVYRCCRTAASLKPLMMRWFPSAT